MLKELGGLLGAAFGLAGDKPKVPEFMPVDSTGSQAKALGANIANFDLTSQLGQKYQGAALDQLKKGMESVAPGSLDMISKGSSTIMDMLAGKLPSDVVSALQRSDASKAVSGGFAGSGFARNMVARDLGLTSLDLSQRGLSAAQAWLPMVKNMTPMFDYQSMFINPAQQLALDQWNSTMQYNRDWASNQINAMPSPLESAGMNLLGSVGGFGDTLIGMALGRNMFSDTTSAFGAPSSNMSSLMNAVGGKQDLMGADMLMNPTIGGYDFNGIGRNVARYA